ncbi:MAG TPA: glycosyltransferase family 39 protein [Gemmatimonadaceae bacterium]|nr:glycosyltransferase family 39 protein [Gemmatimonadaceae bacterium]
MSFGNVVRAWWIGIAAVGALWAVGYVTWPFSSDQGVLSWVGSIIADGGLPYRDAWEIRGPFPFLIYAAISRLFGSAEWPLRVVDLMIVGGGVWCAHRIAHRLGGTVAARCAAALYVLWYASLGHHDTAQSDGWNAAMMAAVMVAMLANDGRPAKRHALIAGVLIGLSILSKPTYAVYLVLPAIVGLGQVRERGGRWLAEFWAVGAAALLAAMGSIVLWLYQGGALGAFFDIHLKWLFAHYTNVESSWMNRAQMTARYLTADTFATAIAPALLGLYAVWARHRLQAALLAAWVVCAIVGVMAQGAFFAYQWHPLYPGLAVLAGVGIGFVFSAARSRDSVTLVIGTAVAGAAFVAALLRPLVHVYRAVALALGLMSQERFDAVEFGPYGRTGPFAQLSSYLRAHTSPRDRVLVWGLAPGVYYEADRTASTRFGYVTPLITEENDSFRQRYRRDFVRQVSAAPPVYVAALSPAVCAKARGLEERRLIGPVEERLVCIDESPDLARLVREHYVPDSSFGAIAVYRRRDRLQQSAGQLPAPNE